jgi:5-formyltetrahydrofolate cyclo-ligase
LLTTVSDPSPPGPRSKRATRQTLRARRDALTADERTAASDAIARAVNALLDARLGAGEVVAVYAAKGTEVETARIAEHAARRGLTIVYPRVAGDDRTLAFHEVSAAELAPGRFGLSEPSADAPRMTLARIAAFVIPGLAFDRTGGRIGWGRGYYDVTLAQAPSALRIGIAFDCQVIDHVPRDPHDVPMSFLITETGTHQVP